MTVRDGPETRHAEHGITMPRVWRAFVPCVLHVRADRAYYMCELRRADRSGVFRDDAHLIVDDLQKTTLDAKALFALGRVESQRPLA